MDNDLTKQTEVMLPKVTNRLKTKAYKKRWLIIIIFIYYASINSLQWLEYSSITNLAVKYYNVSTLAVDWTSTVYFAVYPVLVIPVSYIIDMKGLRLAGLIGCTGNLLASAVKLLSINTDSFWVVMLGQTIAAISQLFIVCLPPKIASVWFKESEVSTACSLGVFGTQMGFAIGFILPPNLVHESDNLEDIGNGLKILCWVLVGAMIPVTLATIIYFPNEPELPPNKAQAVLRNNKEKFDNKIFFDSIKKLLTNKGFIINMVAYSINIATFNSVGIFLNQLILQYFPGADEDVGWMGFLFIITGMIGSIFFGVFLDKTHKYKETSIFIYFATIASLLCLMFAMKYELKIMTYISCGINGLFCNAYMPVGFEFTMELTYPSQESTTTGIVMSSVQLFGVIFAVALGFLNKALEGFWALAVLCGVLIIGNIVIFFVPNTLLRQEAFKQNRITFRRKSSLI